MRGGREDGFTLLEMVLVVAILVILAGSAVAVLSGHEDGARTQLARVEMATLRDACLRWKADLGSFPDPADFAAAGSPLTPLVALAIGPDARPIDATLASGALPQNPPPITVAAPATAMSVLGLFQLSPFRSPALEQWNPVTRRGWRGPYVTFPESRVLVLDERGDGKGTYELADPWDSLDPTWVSSPDAATRRRASDPRRHSRYVYALAGSGFTIASPGPDLVPGTADDVLVSYP